MKKIILSLVLATGSITAFGQEVISDDNTTTTREDVITIHGMVVSADHSGNEVVDIVSGALYRVSNTTPVKVGEVLSINVKIDGSEEIDGL